MHHLKNRRVRCFVLLFILCISAVLLSPVEFSKFPFKYNNLPDDPRIVYIPNTLDRNANKIHDYFESGLNFDSDENVEAIICFTHKPNQNDRDYIKSLGGNWITEFQVIFAAHVSIPVLRLPDLANYYSISAISANSKTSSTLYMSNYQVRARNATWLQQYNGLNLTGSEYFSTAVLDTGIDASHPDLESRVIAWKDFIGASSNVSGDEYATATDFGHHGTHVAGIISGQGNSSKNGYLNVTNTGVIAEQNGYYYYGPAFFKSDSTSRNLIIKQAWNETFTSYVGYSYESGGGSYPTISNNSQQSFSIYSAGQYVSAVGGNRQENITRDIPFTAQVDIPVSTPSDGYGSAAGLAPTSKIVALKVLDDSGSGTKTALLQAFDWCINHKTEYNITVINLSLGFDSIESEIDNAIANIVNLHGIVVVASAGNNGVSASRINSPGSAPYAITVGAVNRINEIAYYSSVGNPFYNNQVIKPDITAPGGSYKAAPDSSLKYGHAIFAADSNYDDKFSGKYVGKGWIDNKKSQDRYPNDYTDMQGTSMSAPHISGIVQLLIQRLAADNDGTWTWSGTNVKKVKQLLLMATSESAALGKGGEATQSPALNRGLKDFTEGWGRIDVLSAISLATEITSFQPKTITFSNSSIGPRVEAFNLRLEKGISYQFDLEMIDSNSDMDLFLYQAAPSEFGEPIELRKSVNEGRGINERITYTPSSTENYYLIVRWANGTGTSRASIFSPTIAEALDNNILQFTSGGNAQWFFQTATTNDGQDALQSGNISHNQSSWVTTTVAGPGNLSFYWKVDSELGCDRMAFMIDGVPKSYKSGNKDWSLYTYHLDPGVHILTWNYSKDSSNSVGLDAAWLDQVSYVMDFEEIAVIVNEISPNPSNDGKITITWNPIIGATKYYIFKQSNSFNNLTGLAPIIESTGTSFLDNIVINGTYYYRVIATNGTHNSSISNEVSVTVAIPTPSAPDILYNEDNFKPENNLWVLAILGIGVAVIILVYVILRVRRKRKYGY